MERHVLELLARHRLLPLLTVRGGEDLEGIAVALMDEGLPLIEVTLRTPLWLQALRQLGAKGLVVGAGTVRTRQQAEEAVGAGASFLVSPAFNPEVALFAKKAGVVYLPGVLTPAEVERALAAGITVLKLFPTETFQGPALLKAYAEVFPEARFVPTGGVREDALPNYAPLPNLLACGGSWLLEGGPMDIRLRVRRARTLLNRPAHG